jgi:hypothetical protein
MTGSSYNIFKIYVQEINPIYKARKAFNILCDKQPIKRGSIKQHYITQLIYSGINN